MAGKPGSQHHELQSTLTKLKTASHEYSSLAQYGHVYLRIYILIVLFSLILVYLSLITIKQYFVTHLSTLSFLQGVSVK